MKKHLPNILLLAAVLASALLAILYISHSGLGTFLRTGGVVFLVLGIIIFIFFLSIDPGYGWTDKGNLTRNYIMIFVSMAVSMAGIVLIVTGQHVYELRLQKVAKQNRCLEIKSGRIISLLQQDWYTLRDRLSEPGMGVYLFQKKSDRNAFRIVALVPDHGQEGTIEGLRVSSSALNHTVDAPPAPECPGLIEQDILVQYDIHHDPDEQIRFEATVLMAAEKSAPAVQAENRVHTFTLFAKGHDFQETGNGAQDTFSPPGQPRPGSRTAGKTL